MKDGRDDVQDVLPVRHAEGVEGPQLRRELLGVVNAVDAHAAAPGEVRELARLAFDIAQDLVQRVVGPFPGPAPDDARLLQQVRVDGAAGHAAVGVERHGHPLAEAARVVVPERLRVAVGFEDRVRLEDAPRDVVLGPAGDAR